MVNISFLFLGLLDEMATKKRGITIYISYKKNRK